MGLFDLPAPLFSAVDDVMGFVLPASLRLVAWAFITGIGTLLLYKVLSPQGRIGEAKREAKTARQKLNRFDGEFADAGPLIKNQFITAFRHIGLVVPGTIIAILPLLCFLVWADNHYGYDLPNGTAQPAVSTVPASAGSGHWQGDSAPPKVTVDAGSAHYSFTMTAPVNVVTKASWWRWLVANPIGYLPDDSPLNRVDIALPEQQFIPFGPSWLHGWLGLFIPVMFIVSLAMFKWARIE